MNKTNEEQVLDWFEQCQNEKINPWEYDLKREIFLSYPQGSGVKGLLNEWAGNYFSQQYIHKPFYEKEKSHSEFVNVETEDCQLMQCIYYLLWGHKTKYSVEAPEEIEADLMNSFFSPYKKALKKANLKNWQSGAYQKEAGDMEELLARYKENDYLVINQRFEDFANATHTIGNCTLVPMGFNKSKHQDWHKSWSESLLSLSNEETLFKDYNKKFYMEDYQKQFSYEDVDYLPKTVAAICQRGKKMTWELMNQLQQKEVYQAKIENYPFYHQLKETLQ